MRRNVQAHGPPDTCSGRSRLAAWAPLDTAAAAGLPCDHRGGHGGLQHLFLQLGRPPVSLGLPPPPSSGIPRGQLESAWWEVFTPRAPAAQLSPHLPGSSDRSGSPWVDLLGFEKEHLAPLFKVACSVHLTAVSLRCIGIPMFLSHTFFFF